MAQERTDELLQLEVRLNAEVQRLHPQTNERRGLIDLNETEAKILLQLVKYARAEGFSFDA